MQGYKVFTYDLCSPIRGGEPVWDGTIPYQLPHVEVDKSEEDYGAGWNFCRKVHTALRIGGLWPNGRPSRLFVVEAGGVEKRSDKCRAATLQIIEEITDLRPAISALSEPLGRHRDAMVEEQLAWRQALSRPVHDVVEVERCLRVALDARGLGNWTLKKFDSAMSARDAWGSWDAGAAWSAWSAWDTRAASDAWSTWGTRDAWTPWAVSETWDAWDAKEALIVFYASRMGWVNYPPDLLTMGAREAYRNGLAIAIPTAKNELGWAME